MPDRELTFFSTGDAIRVLRSRAGKSARALSVECGLSPSYVSKVEAGALAPSLFAFARLAVALRMSSAEILHVLRVEAARE